MKLNTKQDFTDLMHRILDPLLPCYSAGGARLHLGETGASYDRNAIELEAFSRPLWALAPFWLGGGSAPEFERIYQAGLDHGTDPAHPEYWGDTKDYDQCFVEMAAIACAILEVPEKAWKPLSPEARTHLAAWLGTINHHELPNCNWLFFRVLVNLALRSVDMPWDPALLEQDLQNAESWYIGDGWYSDGSPEVKPQRDYYIPWALQYYGVLYSVFAAKEDPERAARFRQRAMEFGSQFMTWFDADGAALPYGRSLTYRFGQCAFYSACIWAGLEPLPLPVMKGIIVRNLQWWMSKPIFDRSGVLTVGYCYPQFFMSERYNAPGSPYWGLKTFIVLGLPDNHPFWTAEAAPLPVQPGVTELPAAHLLMQRTPDGQVNAYAPAEVEQNEHGQFAEKYGKFVYSTRFGFSASRSYAELAQAAPDSMLAFLIGGQIFVRRHSQSFAVQDGKMVSTWSPFEGITVTTEVEPTEQGHIRRHTVVSDRACTAWDCGFAVAKFAPGFAARAEDRTALVANDRQRCEVRGEAGAAEIVDAWPNTSLYVTNTAIPAVKYDIPVGTTTLVTEVTAFARPDASTEQ
ncbi:DUF2264 domain-containing protein [Gemmiger formicilis]|uniref:DUF2264 domain-containing protein n=1 Tax=Gemmiger formicilis TaxID=745368 RepID=UPI0019589D70|nr:DUF2264 domain-containing protein [Gemmiger formicilis]MBM6717451.1 DUF2264 domain-containing protein [Gemmiger formicilis]